MVASAPGIQVSALVSETQDAHPSRRFFGAQVPEYVETGVGLLLAHDDQVDVPGHGSRHAGLV